MAEQLQLRDMLTDLRAEVGHSTNVAHGLNDRETLLFFFKQKTAYELPLCDWSSDVCSSDLRPPSADDNRGGGADIRGRHQHARPRVGATGQPVNARWMRQATSGSVRYPRIPCRSGVVLSTSFLFSIAGSTAKCVASSGCRAT